MSVLEAERRPVWDDLLDRPPPARPAAPIRSEADVVIVGAGFTGLWTAYYLLLERPGRRVMVVDAARVGAGASGRNGGWCSAESSVSLTSVADRHGAAAAIATHEALVATVHEVGRVLEHEGIEAGWAHGGTLHVARNEAQALRLRAGLIAARRLGDTGSAWLDSDAAHDRVAATDVLGGVYTPHCAAVHPASLVHGLAATVERLGATIHHDSPVRQITSGGVHGHSFEVAAPIVIRATEAGTVSLDGRRRDLAPVHSLMIATEPLDPQRWHELRWSRRETFNDARRLVIYAQRTGDGRIAFGGRGAPYHWGSRLRPEFQFDDHAHRLLAETLVELFPVLRDVRITHRWGGALGIARDWWPSVGFDPSSGLGWAGGYAGDGVAASNLAGRTLAALIDRTGDPVVALPWVGHRSRRWEPEPIRWASITAALKLTASADRAEARRNRPARRGAIIDRLTGG